MIFYLKSIVLLFFSLFYLFPFSKSFSSLLTEQLITLHDSDKINYSNFPLDKSTPFENNENEEFFDPNTNFLETNSELSTQITQRTFKVTLHSGGCYYRWRRRWWWRYRQYICRYGYIRARRFFWSYYGITLIAVEPRDGRVIARRIFNTHGWRHGGKYLYNYVRRLKKGTIVLITGKGNAGRFLGYHGYKALRSLGLPSNKRLRYNGPFYLVGKVGSKKESFTTYAIGHPYQTLHKTLTIPLPPIVYCRVYQTQCKWHPRYQRRHFYDPWIGRVDDDKICRDRAKIVHSQICGNPNTVPTTVWPVINGQLQSKSRITYPSGHCHITTEMARRYRRRVQLPRFVDVYGEVYMGAGLVESTCLNRAKQYHRWFRNPFYEKGWVTATFEKTSAKRVWPGPGCWISTPACRKYPDFPRKAGFFRDIWGEIVRDSGVMEGVCFARGRAIWNNCQNTDQEPVVMHFMPSKKSNVFPPPIRDTTDYAKLIKEAEDASKHTGYQEAIIANDEATTLENQHDVEYRAVDSMKRTNDFYLNNIKYDKQKLSQSTSAHALAKDILDNYEAFEKNELGSKVAYLKAETAQAESKINRDIFLKKQNDNHAQTVHNLAKTGLDAAKDRETAHSQYLDNFNKESDKTFKQIAEDNHKMVNETADNIIKMHKDMQNETHARMKILTNNYLFFKNSQQNLTERTRKQNIDYAKLNEIRLNSLDNYTSQRKKALKEADLQFQKTLKDRREHYKNQIDLSDQKRLDFLKEQKMKDDLRRQEMDKKLTHLHNATLNTIGDWDKKLDFLRKSDREDMDKGIRNIEYKLDKKDMIYNNNFTRNEIDHFKQHQKEQEKFEQEANKHYEKVKTLTQCVRTNCGKKDNCPCVQKSIIAANEEGLRLANLNQVNQFPSPLETQQIPSPVIS